MISAPDREPIVVVDDSDDELLVAETCYQMSALTNPWKAFISGRSFLAYLEEVEQGLAPKPALVLLDLNMPGQTGFEVLDAIRASSVASIRPPIFCLTNSQNPKDEQRALSLGAAGYHVKPSNVSDYVRLFNELSKCGIRL